MNTITLISGGPGSGKSTISKLVATHFSKCLRIPVDDLREMLVGLATPDGGFTEEIIHEFQLARSSAIHMAKLYASQGIDVIIDDVCVPDNFAEQYAELFELSNVKRILLMPTRAALSTRILKRKAPWDHILIDNVDELYNFLEPMPKEGWNVLDTSDWTIEKTVQEVLNEMGIRS